MTGKAVRTKLAENCTDPEVVPGTFPQKLLQLLCGAVAENLLHGVFRKVAGKRVAAVCLCHPGTRRSPDPPLTCNLQAPTSVVLVASRESITEA